MHVSVCREGACIHGRIYICMFYDILSQRTCMRENMCTRKIMDKDRHNVRDDQTREKRTC
jgi:hypothetical protein